MTEQFQPGDTVTCVRGCESCADGPVEGDVYTVVSSTTADMRVGGVSFSHALDMFELGGNPNY
jgi:hypothetical protein